MPAAAAHQPVRRRFAIIASAVIAVALGLGGWPDRRWPGNRRR
jgi:hypothetical protein